MKYIDVSKMIFNGMKKYPSDPSVEVRLFKSLNRGDSCNLNKLIIGSHTGTHIDAPRHIFKKGCGVDSLVLRSLFCDVRVVDIKGLSGKKLLSKISSGSASGVILKNAKTGLSVDGAGVLAAKNIRIVGTDQMSIENGHDRTHPVHRLLLSKGIVIVENLELKKVKPGIYRLLCLPLKIRNGDGAPARAVLMHG